MRLIGATIAALEPGRVRSAHSPRARRLSRAATASLHLTAQAELRATFRPDLSQQHGFWHGGIIATLADNACGFAACSLVPLSSQVLAAQMNLHWVAPAAGPVLTAVAEVIKPGRSQSVVAFRVYCGAGDDASGGGSSAAPRAPAAGHPTHVGAHGRAHVRDGKLVAVGTHTVAVLARRYSDQALAPTGGGGPAAAPPALA